MFDDIVDDQDDIPEEEKMEGFTIIDESGAELDGTKKPLGAEKAFKKIVEDPSPAIATPIPDNEQKVIIFNIAEELPEINTVLDMKFFEGGGAVYFGDKKIGDFKPMFVKKLLEEKAGLYAIAKIISLEAPVMILLEFSDKIKKHGIKIEGIKN